MAKVALCLEHGEWQPMLAPRNHSGAHHARGGRYQCPDRREQIRVHASWGSTVAFIYQRTEEPLGDPAGDIDEGTYGDGT